MPTESVDPTEGACGRIGCNEPGTIPIYAPLTQKDSYACEQHIDQMLAIGWERVDAE